MTEDTDPVIEELKKRRLQKLQEELKTKQQEEELISEISEKLPLPPDSLMPLGISNLTDLSFRDFMETYSYRLPIFIDYWAPWCQPCLQVAPIIDSLAKKYHGRIIFTKFNTQNNSMIPSLLDIRGIPTFQIWKNERLLFQLVGAQTYTRFTTWLDAVLKRIESGKIDKEEETFTLKRLKRGKLTDAYKKKEI
ncbi:MAG: thioredoxin family protein [Promethearchaeota archaeon]